MYFEDLTPFEYHSAYSGLNVGWLDGEHEFPTGDTPEGFLDALFAVIASGKFTRCAAAGVYYCEICGSRELIVERGADGFMMGNSEIAVPYDGVDYIAPSLVYHYVEAHRYLPPEPFVQGVMAIAARQK